jgi:hypothetical protein
MTVAVGTVQRLVLEHFPTATTARVLSPNGRAHWASKHAATRSVRGVVAAHALRQELNAMHGLVEIQPTFVYPVARKRDDDNLGTGVMKAVRDALVGRGYLEADDMAHVRQLRPIVEIQRGRRALILEFREWRATSPIGGDESEKVNG